MGYMILTRNIHGAMSQDIPNGRVPRDKSIAVPGLTLLPSTIEMRTVNGRHGRRKFVLRDSMVSGLAEIRN